MQRSLDIVTSRLSEVEATLGQPIAPSTCEEGRVGRPRFDIPKEQLQYFVDWDLTTVDIAQALGVSHSTSKRRLWEYGISIRRNRTVITGALAGEGGAMGANAPPPPPTGRKGPPEKSQRRRKERQR